MYTGITNNLEVRIIEHYAQAGNSKSFTGKYYVHFLLYFEDYKYITEAIAREKEIKVWTRIKKMDLIKTMNPTIKLLNEELFGKLPPYKI